MAQKLFEVTLPLHPEPQHNSVDDSAMELEEEEIRSPLTEYFKLSGTDPLVRDLFYWQMPLFFRWSRRMLQWIRTNKDPVTIGTLGPKDYFNSEREGLRYLLTHRRGCDSFISLRTIEGVEYDFYTDAMRAFLYPLADQIADKEDYINMCLIDEIILHDDEIEYFKFNYHNELREFYETLEENIFLSFELGHF
jgi:hypothetical protein